VTAVDGVSIKFISESPTCLYITDASEMRNPLFEMKEVPLSTPSLPWMKCHTTEANMMAPALEQH
jgi:hypothetical protein